MPVAGWYATHEQIPSSRSRTELAHTRAVRFPAAWSSDHSMGALPAGGGRARPWAPAS
ncbi:MAG TPA: hypothetical protein VET29_29105 [Actinophytocola sp.]|nr:hypothetical protein [Actinophytocola sp.]